MGFSQVCNHPDLFEGRPIVSSFDQLQPISYHWPSAIFTALQPSMWQYPVLPGLNLDLLEQTDDPAWAAQDWQVEFVSAALRWLSLPT